MAGHAGADHGRLQLEHRVERQRIGWPGRETQTGFTLPTLGPAELLTDPDHERIVGMTPGAPFEQTCSVGRAMGDDGARPLDGKVRWCSQGRDGVETRRTEGVCRALVRDLVVSADLERHSRV
jgi:hypothetical protein